jgi:hypothetical protein
VQSGLGIVHRCGDFIGLPRGPGRATIRCEC